MRLWWVATRHCIDLRVGYVWKHIWQLQWKCVGAQYGLLQAHWCNVWEQKMMVNNWYRGMTAAYQEMVWPLKSKFFTSKSSDTASITISASDTAPDSRVSTITMPCTAWVHTINVLWGGTCGTRVAHSPSVPQYSPWCRSSCRCSAMVECTFCRVTGAWCTVQHCRASSPKGREDSLKHNTWLTSHISCHICSMHAVYQQNACDLLSVNKSVPGCFSYSFTIQFRIVMLFVEYFQ